nr:unnamed protein product [Callosobruchus analis]
MAGVEPPPHMDGRSALPLLLVPDAVKRKRVRWPDTFLIESSGRRETPYLDLKMERLHKYSQTINWKNVTELPLTTTEAPSSTSTLTSLPSTNPSLADTHSTGAPRIYDSGEDATSLDSATNDEDSDDEAEGKYEECSKCIQDPRSIPEWEVRKALLHNGEIHQGYYAMDQELFAHSGWFIDKTLSSEKLLAENRPLFALLPQITISYHSKAVEYKLITLYGCLRNTEKVSSAKNIIK